MSPISPLETSFQVIKISRDTTPVSHPPVQVQHCSKDSQDYCLQLLFVVFYLVHWLYISICMISYLTTQTCLHIYARSGLCSVIKNSDIVRSNLSLILTRRISFRWTFCCWMFFFFLYLLSNGQRGPLQQRFHDNEISRPGRSISHPSIVHLTHCHFRCSPSALSSFKRLHVLPAFECFHLPSPKRDKWGELTTKMSVDMNATVSDCLSTVARWWTGDLSKMFSRPLTNASRGRIKPLVPTSRKIASYQLSPELFISHLFNK